MLEPSFGIINNLIVWMGLNEVSFLYSETTALWTIVWITGWKLIGFSTLIVSASLANLNQSVIEAARMDGASEWEITYKVRLPCFLLFFFY